MPDDNLVWIQGVWIKTSVQFYLYSIFYKQNSLKPLDKDPESEPAYEHTVAREKHEETLSRTRLINV